MAAYAALNSVMYILHQIQHHTRPPITIEKQHLDSLCEIISFWQDFLEKRSHSDVGDDKEALENQIADAAYAAEDVIESHIVDQILAEKSSDYNLFCQDLQKVLEDMNLIKKEVIQIQEKMGGLNDDQLPTNIIPMSENIVGSSTVPPPKRKHYTNTMVGFDDVLTDIMGGLIGYPANRQILPIVGMGGIDTEIAVSSLIRLWVAEGFLKPIAAKSLEMVAEEYLNDLIGRNLILVHKLRSSGKVQYCKIHDLLRDLCLREGQKDKFLWVRTEKDLDNLEGIESRRRISIHEGISKEKFRIDRVLEAMPSASLARSLICDYKGVSLLSHSFRLVRVFKTGRHYSYVNGKKEYRYSLKDIFKLVNSRYLEFETKWKSTSISPSIHLLWNLQTLIIEHHPFRREVIDVPPEIWEMCQLRHLEIIGSYFSLSDPPNVPLIHEGDDDDDFILGNLHTLKGVINFKLSEQVIKRIPNIKQLEVSYLSDEKGWWHNYCLNNLGLLNKLESLYMKWEYIYERSFKIEILRNIAFIHSLKKLTLYETNLLWEDMRMIGSLPHLQVLKLCHNSFHGPEWNPVEGEFLCLKFLLIQRCYELSYWNANRTHFPRLEQLVLHYLKSLKEIPLDIGQISTLGYIELSRCSNSLVMSAKNVLDEQVGLGNEDFQVRVDGKLQFSS